MRLLIIEDDRDAADYLVKAFREVGHVADLAVDGEEGLAHALDGQYDVLIVDRMLPKLDGLAVIGTLRGKGIETHSFFRRWAKSTIGSRGCGPAATITSRSPIRSRSCSRARRLSPVGVAAGRKRYIVWAISNSIGYRTRLHAQAMRSCCSRASSACSNIS